MLQFQLNFTCGNSSVVEHNLAMVGVASSTLVSRSIFLLIFLISTAFSITLKEALIDELNMRMQNIKINNIEILAPQNLPPDYQNFILKSVQIMNLREFGSKAKANFIDSKNKARAIVFGFDIDASISAFIATKDIKRGQSINKMDFKKENISIEKYHDDLLFYEPVGLISKANIKKGQVLKERVFTKEKDVKKGDTLVLEISDGGVFLELSAIACESGDINQTIELKANNTRYKAKIISKNRAIIE